jgi:hypothetical protein
MRGTSSPLSADDLWGRPAQTRIRQLRAEAYRGLVTWPVDGDDGQVTSKHDGSDSRGRTQRLRKLTSAWQRMLLEEQPWRRLEDDDRQRCSKDGEADEAHAQCACGVHDVHLLSISDLVVDLAALPFDSRGGGGDQSQRR